MLFDVAVALIIGTLAAVACVGALALDRRRIEVLGLIEFTPLDHWQQAIQDFTQAIGLIALITTAELMPAFEKFARAVSAAAYHIGEEQRPGESVQAWWHRQISNRRER